MEKKNGFSSKIGFILATAGSSVGLGNLWSFPYKTSQNGGAAFVIVYILSVIVLGLVAMIAEIYIGKRAQANPVTAYKNINSNIGWVGLVSVLVPFLVASYYIILGGYTVKYTFSSFSDNSHILESFSSNIWEVILCTGVFLGISVLIISFGVKNGIEKASKILMPILIVLLIGIVIYCLTLGEGVKEGLNYFLNPDFKALGYKGILAAMGQAFFSLSIGAGVLLSYGSYMNKDIKIGSSTVLVVILDTGVAILAGLAIFPAIFHYEALTGIALKNNGIVLLFSSLPTVFVTLGISGKILSFLFFGMVMVAAITSVISILEVVIQLITQIFNVSRVKASILIGCLIFILSIPVGISLGYSLSNKEGLTLYGKNLLEVVDLIVTSVLMPLCAFFACISIGWLLFKDKNSFTSLASDLQENGIRSGFIARFYAFMIKYITPLIILLIEIMGIIDIVFPMDDGKRIFSLGGLVIAIIAIVILLVTILVYFVFLKNKKLKTNDTLTENIEVSFN